MASINRVPNLLLNNGLSIPMIGLGTWNSPKGEVTQAVKDAIDAGYRHIDCAHVYGNEHEVGEAVNAKIAEGVIKREDIFLTSKLWNTFHRTDLVRKALETTLTNLNTPFVDLYLIHWPVAFREGGTDNVPKDADGNVLFSDADYLDTWKEMEKAVDDGLIKSIGVSNFNRAQLERLLAVARIKPVTNQVECHPYLTQQKLSNYCTTKRIVVTAYSPLGSPTRPWVTANDPSLLDEPKLVALAAKYGKSVGQLLIRYQLQRGHVVIPKSVTKSRIADNLDVLDFDVSATDVKVLESFDCNGRICPDAFASTHPHYPFHDEY